MKNLNKEDYKICIVGLGYVGLPLAARFSLKGFDVTGFDIKEERVNQLVNKIDVNYDISSENLEFLIENSKLTSDINEIRQSNIFIVTVPTPINDDKTPDLKPLISASELLGEIIKKDSIIIYESTVYPGVTDEICTPILEEKSKLTFNKDFSTGYSPERIVPGDKVNTIEKITKVVSGSNNEATKIISFLYSMIIDAGIYVAPTIRVAEAAKVIENIQRDVNIALINEIHQLFFSLGINTDDVIEAASTKWNFMKLKPGLVGGHCISIDPYYLMHKSSMVGYKPTLMITARDINNNMTDWVFHNFIEFCNYKNIDLTKKEITILGYTFKENCSDTRNTKVHDLLLMMEKNGIRFSLWDPYLEKEDIIALEEKGYFIHKSKPGNIEVAFICVYHDKILKLLQNYKGVIYDFRKKFKTLK